MGNSPGDNADKRINMCNHGVLQSWNTKILKDLLTCIRTPKWKKCGLFFFLQNAKDICISGWKANDKWSSCLKNNNEFISSCAEFNSSHESLKKKSVVLIQWISFSPINLCALLSALSASCSAYLSLSLDGSLAAATLTGGKARNVFEACRVASGIAQGRWQGCNSVSSTRLRVTLSASLHKSIHISKQCLFSITSSVAPFSYISPVPGALFFHIHRCSLLNFYGPKIVAVWKSSLTSMLSLHVLSLAHRPGLPFYNVSSQLGNPLFVAGGVFSNFHK